jgi:hypothetical protein
MSNYFISAIYWPRMSKSKDNPDQHILIGYLFLDNPIG